MDPRPDRRGTAARGMFSRREPGHPAARRRRREAAEGPLRAGVLGGRRGLRDRAGRHPVHRHPVPAPQGPRPHAQADPWQHPARDRLDDRPGGGARRRHGADGVADLGARSPARGRRPQHHGRGLPVVVGLHLSRRRHGHRLGHPHHDRRHDGGAHRARRLPLAGIPWRRGTGRQRRPGLPGDPLVLGARAVRQAGRDAGAHEHDPVQRRRPPAPTPGSARSSAGCSTGS